MALHQVLCVFALFRWYTLDLASLDVKV